MKVLIIGSDSFIAKKFIEKYNSNYSFTGISLKGTGLENEVITEDYFDVSEDFFSNIDTVINFAAIVHQSKVKDFEIYNRVNCKLAILNAMKAKNAGVKHFIQMSTIAVYGDLDKISVNNSCNPVNSYGLSKLNADQELNQLNNENFTVTILRPPMVYGGGRAPGNLQRLIKLAYTGIPLPFKGINNSRYFINVNNLIQYINLSLENKLTGIFLVCDRTPVSLDELNSLIKKYSKQRITLLKLPKSLLKVIKIIRPKEYNKLFGDLIINNNFPFRDEIQEYSIEDGIKEMIMKK